MNQNLEQLAAALGQRLMATGRVLATAESCTGGWIAQVVTGVAGSSAWFDRGFVTYSNRAKEEMLGVAGSTLAGHGAVSAQVVTEMAVGALARSQAQVAVAVSGIAGPGGGSAEKPVGTVFVAWALAGQSPVVERLRLSGDREAVRRQTVGIALERLLELLGGSGGGAGGGSESENGSGGGG